MSDRPDPMTLTDPLEPDLDPPARAGIRILLVRHPLVAFFLWFFTVGQAFAFAPKVAARLGSTWPPEFFIWGSSVFGLLLPALVLTRLREGPAGLARLVRDTFRVRVPLGWYAAVLVGFPTLVFAGLVAIEGWPAGGFAAVGGAVAPYYLGPLLLTFPPNNWWEEVAWAGFVQSQLRQRHGQVVTALIAGPLFALQHLAFLAGGGIVATVTAVVVATVFITPFRFLCRWLYERTGSLLLAGLLHAVSDAVAVGAGFGPGLLVHLYPASATAPSIHVLGAFAIGVPVMVVVGLRAHRRRGPK